ncbi:MAG TPA: PIN domain-containing protein [Ktedonobacteraceae bacterium]|nr:PIN domain-containing protein [Ktedonobacteraceae bacterium]
MSSIRVILDACVLFPGSLRDVLLRGAKAKLYRVGLTDQILEEMRRNLVEKGHVTEEKGQCLVSVIKEHFPSSFIADHMLLISAMPINEKDRHVLAAAVASGSRIIVTQNLKDFPQSLLMSFEIEALSADDFLVRCFSQDSGAMVNLMRSYVSDLKKPPLTMQETLEKLGKLVPNFVQLVRQENES